MSIQTQLNRLKQAKTDIRSAIIAKGVDVPSTSKIDRYDDYIKKIEVKEKISTVTINVDTSIDVSIGFQTYESSTDTVIPLVFNNQEDFSVPNVIKNSLIFIERTGVIRVKGLQYVKTVNNGELYKVLDGQSTYNIYIYTDMNYLPFTLPTDF